MLDITNIYCTFLAQSGASVKSDEEEFVRVLEGRAKDGNKLKIVDVGRNEKEVEVKEIKVRRYRPDRLQ